MTKIITVSLRERKIVPSPQRREMTKFLQMALCRGWMSQLSGWALYIILFDITPIRGDRIPQKGNAGGIFALDSSPAWCSWMTAWSTGVHASVLSAWPVEGGGVIIVWWTQEWRGHTRANLALVAPLIGPLFMQSSGGAYSKYWSYFDRVFSSLNTPHPLPSIPPTLSSRCHYSGVTLTSNPKLVKSEVSVCKDGK